MSRIIFAAALTMLAAGCGGGSPRSAGGGDAPEDSAARAKQSLTPGVVIFGELTARPRTALHRDSIAVVELRRTDIEDADSLVFEQRIEVGGRQPPFAFNISAPAEAIGEATRLRFQGSVFSDGRPALTSEPVDIDISTARQINIGAINLVPSRPVKFSSDLDCGGERLAIDFVGELMRLKAGTEDFDLKPAPAASGARYEVEGDPTTSVWNKAGRAIITIRGVSLPECELATPPAPAGTEASGAAADAAPKPYVARGNEPFWRFEIADGRIEITPNIGEPVLAAKLPAPQAPDEDVKETDDEAKGDAGARIYAMTIRRKPVRVRIENGPCQDSMAGQFYPDIVSVTIAEEVLSGCGGNPADLLTGAEWVIEDVAGRGIIDASRGTLNFTPEGRVFGMAFCNSFNSAYELTGEGLKFGLAASTMKACAPALMDLERRFFDVLAKVASFEINDTGALVLRGGPDETILARRV